LNNSKSTATTLLLIMQVFIAQFISLAMMMALSSVSVSSDFCDRLTCDFNFLEPGVLLMDQMHVLEDKCGILAYPFGQYPGHNNPINVFNSTAVPGDHWTFSPRRTELVLALAPQDVALAEKAKAACTECRGRIVTVIRATF
jgi:hypothetical protein